MPTLCRQNPLLVEDVLHLSHVVHQRLIRLLALPVIVDEEVP